MVLRKVLVIELSREEERAKEAPSQLLFLPTGWRLGNGEERKAGLEMGGHVAVEYAETTCVSSEGSLFTGAGVSESETCPPCAPRHYFSEPRISEL